MTQALAIREAERSFAAQPISLGLLYVLSVPAVAGLAAFVVDVYLY